MAVGFPLIPLPIKEAVRHREVTKTSGRVSINSTSYKGSGIAPTNSACKTLKKAVSINSTSYKGSGVKLLRVDITAEYSKFPLIPLPIKEAVPRKVLELLLNS